MFNLTEALRRQRQRIVALEDLTVLLTAKYSSAAPVGRLKVGPAWEPLLAIVCVSASVCLLASAWLFSTLPHELRFWGAVVCCSAVLCWGGLLALIMPMEASFWVTSPQAPKSTPTPKPEPTSSTTSTATPTPVDPSSDTDQNPPQPSDVAAIVAAADAADGKGEPPMRCLRSLSDALHRCTSAADIARVQWRRARALFKLSASPVSPAGQRPEVARRGVEAAKAAAMADPQCADAHKWLALCINATTRDVDKATQVANARLFQRHAEAAVKLNPGDATTHHMLGRWCFEMAGLPVVRRKLVEFWYGELPRATFLEAMGHFEEAGRLHEGVWASNQVWLARALLRVGDRERAGEVLREGAGVEPVTQEDVDAHADMVSLQADEHL